MEAWLLTDERRRTIHGVLQEQMATLLAELIANAPTTPLVCTGCGQRVPAVLVTQYGGALRCRDCRDGRGVTGDETGGAVMAQQGVPRAHAALRARSFLDRYEEGEMGGRSAFQWRPPAAAAAPYEGRLACWHGETVGHYTPGSIPGTPGQAARQMLTAHQTTYGCACTQEWWVYYQPGGAGWDERDDDPADAPADPASARLTPRALPVG